jgi:isoquinoline 1-oxidoreductase subunit beta
VSRRGFVKGSAAAALLLGLRPDGTLLASERPGTGHFSAFLEITTSGAIRITLPTTEMGQGVHAALPRIIAEELAADWADVEVLLSYADAAFVSPVTGRQRSAYSEAVKIYYQQLRLVGASAREMLRTAAAAQWGVPATECHCHSSRVIHAASARAASYGSLVIAAAALPAPQQPPLRDPADFLLIGKSVERKDLHDKVCGRTVFGIDVALPGMLHAAMRMPLQLDARLVGFDAAAVRDHPGVIAVVPVDGGVAVIADTFWQAMRAAEALPVEFQSAGSDTLLSTDTVRNLLRAGLEDDAAAVAYPEVDQQVAPPRTTVLDRSATAAALADAQQSLQLDYEVPYLSHLAMEPMVCTALVTDTQCRIWAPTQQPDLSRETAAALTGLAPEQVRLDITFAGGGFGRKWEVDFVVQAVQAAAAVPGRPVKLTWTREQDVRHDFFRPAYLARTRIGLSDGRIVAMHSRIVGQGILRAKGRPLPPDRADPTAASDLIFSLYDFPNKYIDHVHTPLRIPVGWWRSVSQSQNTFFSESAIDEVAAALQRDPLEFRVHLLDAHPRVIRVLQAVAALAGWGRPLPAGRGRGIAFSHGYGSICAQVAEVSVKDDRLQIHTLSCALDCGLQIDPDTIHAQMEGGMTFGLSAALRGDVNFRDGAVVESNFHDQQVLRMHEVPEMRIELIPSSAPPGGVGEAAVPAVAPALANAIYAASSRRIRRLPLSASGLMLA